MVNTLNILTRIFIYVIVIVPTNTKNGDEFPSSNQISPEIKSNQKQTVVSKPALYILIRSPKKAKQNVLHVSEDSTSLTRHLRNDDGIQDYESSQFFNGKSRQSVFHYLPNPLLNVEYKNQIVGSLGDTEKTPAISTNLLDKTGELKTKNLIEHHQELDDIFRNSNIVIEVEEFEGIHDKQQNIDNYVANKLRNFIEIQKRSSFRETVNLTDSHNPNTTENSTNEDTADDVSRRWETPISILNEITRVEGETNMEWETDPITVHLARSEAGDIQLWWAKPRDTIYLQKVVNDGIDQDWCFDNVHINITLRWNTEANITSVNQQWVMGDFEMKYTRDINANISIVWKDDKKDEELLKKYQHYISSWCARNGALFDKHNCTIYDR